jgi:hypothetical protein
LRNRFHLPERFSTASGKTTQVHISAALFNDSDFPAALDIDLFELRIARTDSNILHPDILQLATHPAKERILVLQPRSASALFLSAVIPHTELPNLTKQSGLETTEKNERARRIDSNLGRIVQAPN